MNEQGQRQVVPIFEGAGNRFFVCLEDFVGTNEEEAKDIGAINMFLSFAGTWANYTGEILDVTGGTLHRRAHLAGMAIAVISGPLFDEAVSVVEEKTT